MGICKSKNIENNNENQINSLRNKRRYSDDIKHTFIPIDMTFKALKSLCKFNIKEKKGTYFGNGFFLNIDNSKKYLITNYHTISENITNEEIEIEIYNQKKMKLNLNNHNIKYFPKSKNITIIEIKTTDIIYDEIYFLNYDKNKHKNGYEIYKNLDIFLIGHSPGEDKIIASGRIININGYEFEHNCLTDSIFSLCPIMLLNTKMNNDIQVIGINKEAVDIKSVNRGIFIGEIFSNNELDY